MPNHITNEVFVAAPNAKEILDSCRKNGKEFDFNTIVEMPESLGDVNQSLLGIAREIMGNVTEVTEDLEGMVFEILRKGSLEKRVETSLENVQGIVQIIRNKLKTGHTYWYDWSLANWGTKWNAYDEERIADDTIRFNTAWGMPDEVFIALSEKYPEAEIQVMFADEDIGHNCGTTTYKNGNDYYESPEDPKSFALEVKGWEPEEEDEE